MTSLPYSTRNGLNVPTKIPAASAGGLLSVVVVLVSDSNEGHCEVADLAECLDFLTRQSEPPALEVIVPHHLNVTGIEQLSRRFPEVTFLPCVDLKSFTGRGGSREHHDELRARGIAAAHGQIVALLEEFDRPDPGWAAAMWEAHRQPVAGVGGAIDNGVDRALNWAVYFCDFDKYQNPVPAGDTLIASDANVSYKRSALEAIRPIWQETCQEPAVNGALLSRGERLVLSAKAVVYQHRSDLRFLPSLKERYIWGRSFAASRPQTRTRLKRLLYAGLTILLPPVLVLRLTKTAVKRRRCLAGFIRALPLLAPLTISWSLGELVGYLAGRVKTDLPATGDGFSLAGGTSRSQGSRQPRLVE